MRVETTTIVFRRNRNPRVRRALALAVGVCALAVPATASAAPIDSANYPPANEQTLQTGAAESLYGESTAPAAPASQSDGFDWGSAAVGAGAVAALAALAAAALLTARRHTAMSPSQPGS
jgi:hypothetical protein